MQEDSARPITGQDRRSAVTRGKLVAAARRAFAETGFHDASTPAIAKAAGVSRGALYHQFEDKTALFRAVVEDMQHEVYDAIETATRNTGDPLQALKDGSRVFLDLAARDDFVRIVMIDGPAVLGLSEWRRIDRENGIASLKVGLEAAATACVIRPLPLEELAILLSGAMNEGVMHILAAPDRAAAMEALCRSIDAIFDGLR
ncbi:MAG: TetR/AcrR family transcriptional regulator [Minwuia sp.]|uniref:TetR/AcrR family transcriptional regulator n=1 Tax=Minwuia sp. TaxID=2493630 RepID=UPI003A87451F